ncbi:MAG TPA: hypothetical protein VMT42_06675 [candidate division Zixibacteria bacterium]|nr:hypothetical protein [candidate division Zixibacteria bacterium]
MTIFKVETYIIKPEKQEEYMALVKKWTAYMKNKEKCKELKSWKLFSQMIGGTTGAYFEMGEFENLADFEKLMDRIEKDKEFQTIMSSWNSSVVLGTYSISIWKSVP